MSSWLRMWRESGMRYRSARSRWEQDHDGAKARRRAHVQGSRRAIKHRLNREEGRVLWVVRFVS